MKISLKIAILLIIFIPFKAKCGIVEDIIARGYLTCGVRNYTPMANYNKEENKWQGFEIDICRAIATIILKDPDKIKPIPILTASRIEDLFSGKYDVLLGLTTINFRRSAVKGITPLNHYFFDFQTGLVKEGYEKNLLSEIAKKRTNIKVCFLKGATGQDNFVSYLYRKEIDLRYETKVLTQTDIFNKKIDVCDILIGNSLILKSYQQQIEKLREWSLLIDRISFEPATIYIKEDAKLMKMVQLAFYIMIIGENKGIKSSNIDEILQQETIEDYEVKELLGISSGADINDFGVYNNIGYKILKNIGNYEELFERYLGQNKPYKVERGINKVVENGGLIFSPVIGKKLK